MKKGRGLKLNLNYETKHFSEQKGIDLSKKNLLLKKVIGSGGFGTVYLFIHDDVAKKKIAVKSVVADNEEE